MTKTEVNIRRQLTFYAERIRHWMDKGDYDMAYTLRTRIEGYRSGLEECLSADFVAAIFADYDFEAMTKVA